MSTPIVRIEHVKQYFPVTKEYTIKALDDVSLTIQPGETVGLIGESGCGKSTLARTIMGLYVPTEGTIFFHDQPISDSRVRRSQGLQIHRGLQMIFQDSDGALNPRMTAEEIIREGLVLAKRCQTQAECTQRVAELLQCVDLELRYGQAYPGELSGGQRQRVAIARCLGVAPEVIIADEPIAALDVSIQAQILNLLQDLQERQHFSMLFIAHDLAVVRHVSQRVAVMYAGKIVETGPTETIFTQPVHPYTRILLASILKSDPDYERTKTIPPFDTSTFALDGKTVLVGNDHWVLQIT